MIDRRLPPLNALRAFESAARHLSLTRAAEELHVTPAAVSHQVKGLEAYLGVKLFRRANRALLLTDAGQACVPGLREGFDHLATIYQFRFPRVFRGNYRCATHPNVGRNHSHFRHCSPTRRFASIVEEI